LLHSSSRRRTRTRPGNPDHSTGQRGRKRSGLSADTLASDAAPNAPIPAEYRFPVAALQLQLTRKKVEKCHIIANDLHLQGGQMDARHGWLPD
jgi:hypothetical protein